MPKYTVIMDYLRELMNSHDAPQKLPSVRELMARFSASTPTVTRALQELEHANLIVKHPGRGIQPVHADSVEARLSSDVSKNMRSVLLIGTDYPNETVWSTKYLIEHQLRDRGIMTINVHLGKDMHFSEMRKYITEYKNEICGVILHGFTDKLTVRELVFLSKLPFRVAFLSATFTRYDSLPPNCAFVKIDYAAQMKLALDCFERYGHSKIAYVQNEPAGEFSQVQIRTLKKYYKDKKLPVDDSLVFSEKIRPWDNTMEMAQRIVRKNIPIIRKLGVTGLYFLSPDGALAALAPLAEAGLRVPQDISIISQGDLPVCEFSWPPITVVNDDMPKRVKATIDFLEDAENNTRFILVQPSLKERGSVAKPQN